MSPASVYFTHDGKQVRSIVEKQEVMNFTRDQTDIGEKFILYEFLSFSGQVYLFLKCSNQKK